jgi:hypothetical protein
MVHILVRYPIDVNPIPEAGKHVNNVVSISFRASAIRGCRREKGWRRGKDTYIIQVFSLARRNSETFRKGIPWIFMTFVSSRCRGPVSPAGRISIWEPMRKMEGRQTDVSSHLYWWDESSIGDVKPCED